MLFVFFLDLSYLFFAFLLREVVIFWDSNYTSDEYVSVFLGLASVILLYLMHYYL